MECPKCGKNGFDGIRYCEFCDVTGDTVVTSDTASDITGVPKDNSVTNVTLKRLPTSLVGTSAFIEEPVAGELCQLCGEKKPSVAALKQRAWRAKQ